MAKKYRINYSFLNSVKGCNKQHQKLESLYRPKLGLQHDNQLFSKIHSDLFMNFIFEFSIHLAPVLLC
jgi:hypothetical protein